MPSHLNCSYKNCDSTKISHPELMFHRFPLKSDLQTAWILRSGNDFSHLTPKQIHGKRLCSLHFDTTDYDQKLNTNGDFNKTKMLRRGAKPIDVDLLNYNNPTDENDSTNLTNSTLMEETILINPLEEPTETNIVVFHQPILPCKRYARRRTVEQLLNEIIRYRKYVKSLQTKISYLKKRNARDRKKVSMKETLKFASVFLTKEQLKQFEKQLRLERMI